jgi:quercetin dioxygenase-like cupin family protein
MRLALVALTLSCAGSKAEKAPAEEPVRRLADFADCAGPMAYKCKQRKGGGLSGPVATPAPDPPPEKVRVPDAIEAGPGTYKVLLENTSIRVLEASYQPGTVVPMHRHPDHIVLAMSGGKRITSHATAKTGGQEQTVDSGVAVFQEAGVHQVEVAGPAPTRAVLVELLGAAAPAVPAGDDPVTKSPRTHKLVLDTGRARVLDVRFGKGKSRRYAHGDFLLHSMTKGRLLVGGKRLDLDVGQFDFFPAGLYASTNPARESFEVVLVELKPSASL